MDNNNNSQKPRKKVTKEVLRRRQLTALAVIALIVLIFIILIANACTDKSGQSSKKDSTTTSTTTTTTTTTTEIATEPPTTTTTEPPAPAIDPNLSALVQLSTREITIEVGESDMPYIYSYPDGSSEDNEIWTSSDSNIATVDDLGNITGVNPGECNIILQFDNNPAIEVQIKVTVTGMASVPETPSEPVVPETPSEAQPEANIPDTQENQDFQNISEIPEYQADSQPDMNNNIGEPSNLYANSQGLQDTMDYAANAENFTSDDTPIQ